VMSEGKPLATEVCAWGGATLWVKASKLPAGQKSARDFDSPSCLNPGEHAIYMRQFVATATSLRRHSMGPQSPIIRIRSSPLLLWL
jgi:hypothetical protein